MSKHTPGPWVASERGTLVTATVTREINGRMRTYEQKIATTPSGIDRAERLANAQVMSSAPDLLEAARAAFQCIASLPETQERSEVAVMLLAAVAKAEGRA